MRPIYLLSGGQKSRVSFSIAAWGDPQILIMDEPTNHLDMQTIDGLIEGLSQYQGGILIVSHDQYFITRVCREIWYIKDQRLRKFRGEFEDYKRLVLGNDS